MGGRAVGGRFCLTRQMKVKSLWTEFRSGFISITVLFQFPFFPLKFTAIKCLCKCFFFKCCLCLSHGISINTFQQDIMRQNWQRSLIMRCTVTVVLSVLPTAPPGFSTLNFTTFCTSAALFTLFLFSSQFDDSVIAEITEPFEMTAEWRRLGGREEGVQQI